jgi:hypothetical protein
MIIYPKKHLPLPLLDGYALSTKSPLVITELSSGLERQRRKFTNVPTRVQAKWICTRQQAAFFEAWFARELMDGVNWFQAELDTPAGFGDYICKFRDIYQGPELIQGKYWGFSAELVLRKRPLIEPGWEQFPDLWFGAGIIDLALNREWPEA